MKILVTGGAGFIGTNLIKELIRENHDITSIDNYVIGSKSNHIAGVKYIEADIDQLIYFNEWFDVCFHLCALSRIQPSFEYPLETFNSNAVGTQVVLEWARKNNVSKVIYAGSSSRWHNHLISPYATSKYIGEELCKMYRTVYGMDIEICRFYNVYGPHEINDGGNFSAIIGKWRYQIDNDEPLTIVGDGEQRRDFTHVSDIIDGLLKVAYNNFKHDDAWELGSGKNYSINELFKMFKAKFNVSCKYIPDQHGNYRETKRENDDMLELLNWHPNDRIREYIDSL
jgi:UDP-glucose 4-epimerase